MDKFSIDQLILCERFEISDNSYLCVEIAWYTYYTTRKCYIDLVGVRLSHEI